MSGPAPRAAPHSCTDCRTNTDRQAVTGRYDAETCRCASSPCRSISWCSAMNPIDLTRLRDFSDGTESGLRDLAALFVTHMEECLLAIRRGVAEHDSEVIDRGAPWRRHVRGLRRAAAGGAAARGRKARRRGQRRGGVGAAARARGRSRARAGVPRSDARAGRDAGSTRARRRWSGERKRQPHRSRVRRSASASCCWPRRRRKTRAESAGD